MTRNAKAEELGRTFLKPGVPATIGRAPDSTIFLAAPSLSRRQGRLEVRDGSPVYFDDETSTGAQVNGQYVRGPTRLDEKSVLEMGGFQFTVERDPHAKPPRRAAAAPAPAPAPVAAPNWESAAASGGADIENLLAKRIQGIRQSRQQNTDENRQRKDEVEAEWKQLVEAVRGIQAKLSGDPRVQAFSTSRDQGEVLLKIADRWAPRGVCSLILARRHPDGKYPELDGAWLLELGQKEQFYASPKEAMQEFVERLAPRLA